MQIRSFFLVEFQAIPDNESNLIPELRGALVNVKIQLVEDGSEVHGLLDDLEVVGATVSFRIDWLAEKNSVMDVVFGKVEEFWADHH